MVSSTSTMILIFTYFAIYIVGFIWIWLNIQKMGIIRDEYDGLTFTICGSLCWVFGWVFANKYGNKK